MTATQSLEGLRLGRQTRDLLARLDRLETDLEIVSGGSGLKAVQNFAGGPTKFARDVLGFDPHPWQEMALDDQGQRLLMLCCRQSGKSVTTAALAIHMAATQARYRVIVVAPGARQSRLFVERCALMLRDSMLWRDVEVQQNQIRFANGSVIRAFPGNADTIRGESADLLILDEAAMMLDELYAAVLPMIAATAGKVIVLSTPKGQRGFFYRLWSEQGNGWTKIKVTADDAPSLSPEEIDRLKAELPAYAVRQELYCDFLAGTEGVFAADDIVAALEHEVTPLWLPDNASILAGDRIDEARRLGSRDQPVQVVVAVDLGLHPDWSGLVVAITSIDPVTRRRVIQVPVVERIRDVRYSQIRQRLVQLDRLLRTECRVAPTLVVDASGGGHDFSDQLRMLGVRHLAAVISHTTGKRVGNQWTVGKADLVCRLQTILQDRSLHINRDALATPELVDELTSFSAKISETGWLSYEGKGSHDDLVIALALMAWTVDKVVARRATSVRLTGY